MKIRNNVLLEVEESDLVDGHFGHKKVVEVADGCFNEIPTLKSVSLPKVKKIGSDCFRSNDSLTSVSLPELTECGSDCFSWNGSLTSVSLKGYDLDVKDVDGFCFVIESERTSKGKKIYRGYNLLSMNKGELEKESCYVAEKDEKFAHGNTVKQACEDLNFKIIAEKLKNDPIQPDTVISVQYYPIVTGACQAGCESWMRQNNITEDRMPAKELLPLLEKSYAYGVYRFKELCDWVHEVV